MGAQIAEKKSFADVLASGWSLFPIVGGASLLIISWGLDWQPPAVAYASGVALLIGFVAIVVQMAAASAVDPAIKELRQQLMQTMSVLGQERKQSQKAERFAAEAPPES
jgi:hypothetical protein